MADKPTRRKYNLVSETGSNLDSVPNTNLNLITNLDSTPNTNLIVITCSSTRILATFGWTRGWCGRGWGPPTIWFCT